jgi:zinc protease
MTGHGIKNVAAGAAIAVALGMAPHAAAAEGSGSGGGSSSELSIPFEKYRLDNGLTVILHRDSSLPIVAVNTLFKVGSRFEEPKRTGFAHLFEHLMFMGTDRVPTKMFDSWMEAEGGWNNAWTSNDRTDYYDVAPAHALPLLLWLEADRFSSLARDMTLEKLDAQREVVRNERRQTSENEPYGRVHLRLPELLYPKGHPYHHPVIGSHEDLQAATVEDVKAFFHKWYIPSNASLVIAGDFNPSEVKALVERYFGWMRSAEVPPEPPAPPAKLAGVVRETMEDDVQLGKIVMAWHSPAHFAPGDAELDLASAVLEQGKASRLYKALVYDRPLAQSVTAYQASQDRGSYFVVEAIARPGVELADLEKAIDAELARLAKEPVTREELDRAKNQYETSFVSRLQSVASRASTLNMYESSVGDPGYAARDLARYRSVTPASLLEAAKGTLDLERRVIIYVVPRADGAAQGAKEAP